MDACSNSKSDASSPALLKPNSAFSQEDESNHIRPRAAGFETRVLESLRPVWPSIDEVILELQPRAWGHANVSLEGGLATLHELMAFRHFSAITLPHTSPRRDSREESTKLAKWDACRVPPLLYDARSARATRSIGPSHNGLGSSARLSASALEVYVRNVMREPGHHGWFSEVMLTNRSCL